MEKGLYALATGAFALGMTEFVMMGILPDVARSLNISIPSAGHLISTYALGVVVGAPLLTFWLQRIPPRCASIILATWIMVGNTLTAIASGYYPMIFLRFFSSIPHGVYFGYASVVAGKMVDKDKAAQSVAFVFTGLTIANIIRVPIGTYIGNLNWRLTFAIVGVLGLLTIIGVRYNIPALDADSRGDIKKDFPIFKKAELLMVIAITTMGTGCFFAWYSYIAPLFTVVAKFETINVTYLMVVAGAGMTVGNLVGGKLADHYDPLSAVMISLSLLMIVLLLLVFVSADKVMVTIMTFIIGGVAFAIVPPAQIMMMRSAKEAEMLGSAIGPAAMNVGNALGAYLAGLPLIFGYGYTTPDLVGAILALIGLFLALLVRRYRKTAMLIP